MDRNMHRYMRLCSFIILTAAAVLYGYGDLYADVYIIPCSYRVEVVTVNGTADDWGTDFARIGGHYVGDDRYDFYTWAEFDISFLAGETVAGAGLMVYNDWTGTRISGLRYTPVQPSSANMYQMYAQHTRLQNMYAGFSWTVNPGDAWMPDDGTFYTPDWNNHKRIYDNNNTLINDLQAHIDDPVNTWFALEFSYFGTDRANFRFPSDVYNPASVVLAVVTFSDGKNQGDGGGSCETDPSGGEPINFSTGNEHFTDEDLILTGPGLTLNYVRHYNSRSQQSSYIGYGWTGSWSEHLTADTDKIILHQADGGEVHFDGDGNGKYISEAYTARVIEPDGIGGYVLKEPDGKTLLFDGNGNLTQIRDRSGNTQNIFYAGGKPSYTEDSFGRRIDFSYSTDGFLQTLTTPAGVFTYTYDVQGNLAGVTKPDMTVKTYRYTDINDPHNLTEAENENGALYRFEYDTQDRATHSEFAGTGGITVSYQGGTSRKIADSLGRETVFELQVSKGIGRVKSVTGTGCGQCVSPSGGKYTSNDRVQTEQSEDAQGNITKYTYDSRGNVLTKTEAYATPQQRTFTYTWHPQYSFVTSVTRESTASPGNNAVTSFTYDTTGNLRQKTENGYSGTAPVSRTTSFDYNAYGQITFIDGPRTTDITDTLTFEYYANEAGQGLNRGMLKKITDGAGNETQFSQYSAWGKPCQTADMNGIITAFTYDVMGRIKTKNSAGLTTSYDYDGTGNLTAVHLPGSRNIFYTYTSANFLEKIQDDESNYIKYFYDTEGNRTKQEIHDKNSVLKQFTDYEPDDYNRLKKIIYPDGVYEEYGYDGNNNVTQSKDAKNSITAYGYDALDRLTALTQPGNRVTAYGYDSHDNLKTVTDAKNNVTSYSYDDFGRRISVSSPDGGPAAYQYDNADNVISRTDGNGITVIYQYDTLNRFTSMQFLDPSQNISFGYDAGTYGKGKLTSVTDPAGTTAYSYNERGQLTQETRITEGHVYSTQYHYDAVSGELSGMTYPSGLNITYQRDIGGRISGITSDGQSVIRDVTYMPFGPVNSMTFGNNVLNLSEEYSTRYLTARISAGSILDYQYTRDSNGNVETITGISRPPLYSATTDYSHTANRLTESTGAEHKVYSYDGNGNIISNGTKTCVYNQNNRLVQVKEGETVLGEYAYDAFGRRVKKTVSGIATVYHYDTVGNLIAETSADGTPSRDYIYPNGEPVAVKLYGSQTGWYYFINDHLGTPQKIINSAGEIVWNGYYQPFGKALAYPADITNNFRFPGQYYDAETGLHYNWNRYYDPDTGRYLTPDPIGLNGGINLYTYARGNPANLTDPDGQHPLLIIWGIIEAALSAYDVYTTFETVADPDADSFEKGTAVGLFIIGMVSPGAGYSSGAEACKKVAKKKFPRDFPSKNTKNWSANFKSEGEARALAREKLGKNPVEVEPGKWRSQDGKWQYRSKPGDVGDRHIHLEKIDPATGEVLQNVHLRWPEGGGR